ncbi:nuclear transport factor 2 family protein [Brevundimonas sp. GCM10030266]|uniref:nuclear transport factor 2 family protein n=1 Tax=Brevundimonas sp. GCM10030266 TaxID=3273386 RepID=UPI0036063C7F
MRPILTTLAALTLALTATPGVTAVTRVPDISATQASSHTDAELRNLAAVQTAFDAWRAGTGGPFDLLAEDAVWTITGRSDAAGTYEGKAAFIDRVIAPFNARMIAGIRPTIRSIHVDGDTVIIFFDASGMAHDGLPYDNTYAWFMTFSGDRVIRVSAFYDSLAFNALWRRVQP